jgi:Tol biopolymer transport system component
MQYIESRPRRLRQAGRALQWAVVAGFFAMLVACRSAVVGPEPAPVIKPVASVELDLTQVNLHEGASRTLVATARDATGKILSGRKVSWLTLNAAVATVDTTGRLTAVHNGSTVVTATVEGHSASADVTVVLVPVSQVVVSPGAAVVEIGEQRQLQAVAKDVQGNVLDGRVVQWLVDNGNASVTPEGMLTGLRRGYVTVTASSEGMSTSIGATVIEPVPYDWDLLYHRVKQTGESEIFILPVSGGATPFRLNAGNVSRGATASPDGSRIAFAVSQNDLATGGRIDDLFAVDRNGLNMKRLTSEAGIDDSPDWSPAGARITWVHWELEGRSDIWVMNADGSEKVNLTADLPAPGVRRDPTWSRDGLRIAYSEIESGPEGTTSSIWIINADGSGRRMLTTTLTGFDSSPTWSPGGQSIAFSRYYGAESDITVIDIESGTLRRIPLAGYESSPAWSPDGSMIAFSKNGNALYTMRPDGAQLRLRTTNPTWGGGLAPAWISRPQ